MENKQMAYIIVPHQYYNYTAKGNGGNGKPTGVGTVGIILMIVVPFLIWIIVKKLDNEN